MKWSQVRIPDVKRIVDRYNIINRTLDNDNAILAGFGTPTTAWINTAITKEGTLTPNIKKCYCWNTQSGSPDRTHFLCAGTGSIGVGDNGEGAYQKYGYTDIIFTTVNTCTLSSSNIIKTGSMGGNYTLSGNAVSGTITTPRYTLDNLQDVSYFLINDKVDTTNSIEYYYSTDDVNYIRIYFIDNPNKATEIFSKLGGITLPSGTEYIRFQIILKRNAGSTSSPTFNAIKFRYRKMPIYGVIDTRFSDVAIPAFLSSREAVQNAIEANEFGWVTRYPIRWRVGPESDVRNNDVIMFLKGEFINFRFEIKDLVIHAYGDSLQVLHKNFESRYIRDNKDLLGVINYLN
jgi:hypothetical protein